MSRRAPAGLLSLQWSILAATLALSLTLGGGRTAEPSAASSAAQATGLEPGRDRFPAGQVAPETAGPVTIALGGDIHFEGTLRARLLDDPVALLDPVAEMMAGADLAIANLETTVTEQGTPVDGADRLRTGPEAFIALRAAGIDVVSMANDHGMDHGIDGLEDSLASAGAAGLPIVGIGRAADAAYAPWSTVINGQRIAVLGATQVPGSTPLGGSQAGDLRPGMASAADEGSLLAAVEAARSGHDTVVVYLHWGIEGSNCPAARQERLADRLIAAGADVIVGTHAHRIQGGGLKGGAVVHYGLGNLVFSDDRGARGDSGVLLVTVRGGEIEGHRWVPARLRAGVANRLSGKDAVDALEAWNHLRSCTDLDRVDG